MKKQMAMLLILSMLCINIVACSNLKQTGQQETPVSADSIISELSTKIDTTLINKNMEFLTAQDRGHTAGQDVSSKYIYETLISYNYEALLQEYKYNGFSPKDFPQILFGEMDVIFPVADDFFTVYDENDNTKPKIQKNIIAVKKSSSGTNEKLIFTAHYDAKGGQGANDNASGVVTILEVARLIQNVDLSVDIYFVFLDGEEFGLSGARYYISTLSDEDVKNIIGNVNIDCVAVKDAGDLYMYSCDGNLNIISQMFESQLRLRKGGQSDHFLFYAKQIPSIMLCQDVGEILKTAHGNDSIDNISEDKLNSTINLILSVLINNFYTQI